MLAGRGCRQSFGDLRLAREIALVRRVRFIPELIGQSVQRRAHKVFIRRRRRFRIESGAVRRQRDGA